MPDINFSCPHCSQELEAPEEMAGDTLACPACGMDLTVPAAEQAPPKPLRAVPIPAPVVQRTEAGTCPECQANLAEGAVICISCGLNLKTGKKIDTNL